MANVDPGVRSDRVENANGGVGGVCMHEGNGTVERHSRVRQVLKHVGVEQAIRVSVMRVLASGSGKVKTGGVLGDPIDMTMVGEVNIHR